METFVHASACIGAFLLALAPAPAAAEPFAADTSASRLVVRTTKSGLLSGLAHDHQMIPDRWSVRAWFDPARPSELEVEVVVEAASLHDHEPRLNAANRERVDREATGPEVLDAARYPEIRFRSRSVSGLSLGADGTLSGTLHGRLSLHGTEKEVEVSFRASPRGDGYQVDGTARFAQTAFGMVPYTTAMGTIGVDDEVRIELELALRPGGGKPTAGSRRRPGCRAGARRPARPDRRRAR
jgi:polyisoprenoid-binding protein YceI